MSTSELPESAVANGRGRLNGWKEIADHLDKGVRTAQRWEMELGLPVHRLPGRGREIIFAFRIEIDQWLLKNGQISDTGKEQTETATKEADLLGAGLYPKAYWHANPKLLRSWAVGSTALLLATLLVVFLNSPAATLGPPAQYHFDANTLVVTDKGRHDLWTKFLDAPVFKWRYSDEALTIMGPPVWFEDLDGDSRRETVFLYDPVTRARSGSLLFCYSEQGDQIWHFATTKAVRDIQSTYEPPSPFRTFW